MTFLTWDEKYSLGNELIDNQHKQLFRLADGLGGVSSGEREENFYTALSMLEKYAIEHFKDEEDMLEKNGYPDLENHRAEHKVFVRKVRDYREAVMSGVIPYQDLLDFLKKWLVDHITVSDRRFAEFMDSEKQEQVRY